MRWAWTFRIGKAHVWAQKVLGFTFVFIWRQGFRVCVQRRSSWGFVHLRLPRLLLSAQREFVSPRPPVLHLPPPFNRTLGGN